jgi:hypothetical protein
MSNTEKISVTVTLEVGIQDGAVIYDEATACVHGQGVRGCSEHVMVMEKGGQVEAMAEALRRALLKVSGHGKLLPEPQGYSAETIKAKEPEIIKRPKNGPWLWREVGYEQA